MKKSMIALIISVVFLTICMFLVVKTNKQKENTVLNDMTVEYVDTNYEIDLYDSIDKNKILLEAKAKYIGNDEIKENPKVTIQINCSYVYEDAAQKFTDLLTDDLILNNSDKGIYGELALEIERDSVDSYSCSYKVVETSGKYLK